MLTVDQVVSFSRSMGYYMEIYSEEHKAPKDAYFSTKYIHPLDSQRETVELAELVMITRDVVVIRERPT